MQIETCERREKSEEKCKIVDRKAEVTTLYNCNEPEKHLALCNVWYLEANIKQK